MDAAAGLPPAVGANAITALPETFVPCKRSIGRSNATGTKCCAAGVGPGASRGTCSTRLNSGNRSCDQSCTFPIGSYNLSQCCESSSEERSAGNPHATFCGNRGRATASGDPVGGIARCPPIDPCPIPVIPFVLQRCRGPPGNTPTASLPTRSAEAIAGQQNKSPCSGRPSAALNTEQAERGR